MRENVNAPEGGKLLYSYDKGVFVCVGDEGPELARRVA